MSLASTVDGGKEQVLSPEAWPFTARVEWLPDMSGLLVIAGDSVATASRSGFFSYPEGQKRRITNDLSTYRALAWPVTTPNSARFEAERTGLTFGWFGMVTQSWPVQLPTGVWGFTPRPVIPSPGHRTDVIVYVSTKEALLTVWLMDADGKNRKSN